MTSLPVHAGNAGDAPRRVATIVRTDPHSGRLVRTVVASPKIPKSRPVTAPPSAAGPDTTITGPDEVIGRLVEKAAREYDVDPLLVHSVIQVESNYNPYAVSAKGARGLMQLIPATARRFGVTNTFDARQNIEGGVKYLRYLQDLFGDDRLAIAAYNAGEGAVLKYGWIPPYAETQSYVQNVGSKWGAARKAADSKQQPPAVPIVKEPEFRPLEVVRDENGKVYLRTR